jgi:hypothetical protein
MITQHAAVWSASPVLHSLKLTGWRFSPVTAAAIAAATSLTSLWLECSPDSEADISAALAPLKQLRGLQLYVEAPSDEEQDPVAATILDSNVFADSVDQLVLCRWPLSPVARTQLFTRTQLQKLIIGGSSIGDDDLEVMAHYMRRLQLLGVACNGKISPAGFGKALDGTKFPALLQLLLASCDQREALALCDAAQNSGSTTSPLVIQTVPAFSATSVQSVCDWES